MDREDLTLLQDMLYAAQRAVRLATGRERHDLDDEDDPLAPALIDWVTVVGEAAYKLDPEARKEIREIPWQDVIGMRHRLVHGYRTINYTILWATVKTSLPELIDHLESAGIESDAPSQ